VTHGNLRILTVAMVVQSIQQNGGGPTSRIVGRIYASAEGG
jgi:hypothetical protein